MAGNNYSVEALREFYDQNKDKSITDLVREYKETNPDLEIKLSSLRRQLYKFKEEDDFQLPQTYTVDGDKYKVGSREFEVSIIDKVFYSYSVHGRNMSSTYVRQLFNLSLEEWYILKRAFALYKDAPAFSPHTWETLGDEEKIEMSKQYKLAALADNKSKIDEGVRDAEKQYLEREIMERERELYTTQELTEDFAEKVTVTHIDVPKNPNPIEQPIYVNIADLHIGAKVDRMKGTLEYSSKIVEERLQAVAYHINSLKSSEVTINFLGDLIESFTGLNHKNTFHNLEYGKLYNNVVIHAFEMLREFVSNVNNVVRVTFVSGNHDRVTSSSDEDVYGNVVNMIAYMFQMHHKGSGIQVLYEPFVNMYEANGHRLIYTHGHLRESYAKKAKLSSKPKFSYTTMTPHKFLLKYGSSNLFNVVTQGHLHKRDVVMDESQHRWLICPSIFTGNTYSENEGYTTCAGFTIYKLVPKLQVIDISL